MTSVQWYPDSRVFLLAATFPCLTLFITASDAVVTFAAFVAGHSGGAVLDLHQFPSSHREHLENRSGIYGRQVEQGPQREEKKYENLLGGIWGVSTIVAMRAVC